jgi:hypothetical protein
MNVIKKVPHPTRLRREFWTWKSNHPRMNETQKLIINRGVGLLVVTKRNSSQSVHLHDLTMNIITLLCHMCWEIRNNAEYLSATRETLISERYTQILSRNTIGAKRHIPKKAIIYMKFIWRQITLYERKRPRNQPHFPCNSQISNVMLLLAQAKFAQRSVSIDLL